MWSLQDKIEIYILKYKEELFRYSKNAALNESLIIDLRETFNTKLRSEGEKSAQRLLDQLASPAYLAKKHLKQKGVSVRTKRNLFLIGLMLFAGLSVLIIISLFLITYLFVPNIQKEIEERVLDYSFQYQESFFNQGVVQSLKGRQPLAQQSEVSFEGSIEELNLIFKDINYVSYECEAKEVAGNTSGSLFYMQESIILFTPSEGKYTCKVEVPSLLKARIKLDVGTVIVREVESPTSIELNNGQIEIQTKESFLFSIDASTQNGNVEISDKVQQKEGAIPLQLKIQNGSIKIL